MRSERGFSLLEVVVVVGIAGLLAAAAVPRVSEALRRNRVFTSSELVGATFREARLAAVTRNAPFRVLLNCGAAVRYVAVTGNGAVDNAADRCVLQQANDGPLVALPAGITFTGNAPQVFEISGRGEISIVGGGFMPRTLTVNYDSYGRDLIITAAGRIRTPTN